MICYLKGSILEKKDNSVVVITHDIGYEVFTDTNTLFMLNEGADIVFYTHHVIREDTDDLYGFVDKRSLAMFKILLSVSGIGPKTALGILNNSTVGSLESGIKSGNAATFSKTTGIGKKTAEKIIFALTGKIDQIGVDSVTEKAQTDIVEALTALGYQDRDIRETIKNLSLDGKTAAHAVKEALKLLQKK